MKERYGKAGHREVPRKKHRKQQCGFLCMFKVMPSPETRVSCGLVIHSSWYKKRDTFTNGDFLFKFPYKRVTSAVFRVSSVSSGSQNNQPKIILVPKSHILGWHPLLPFILYIWNFLKKFRSLEAGLVDILLNQSLSPEKISVQLNSVSFQETVMAGGLPKLGLCGGSNRLLHRWH